MKKGMKKFLLSLVVTISAMATIITPTFASTASWYGSGFHGKKTASGETYNQNLMTAAHRKFKMGTKVRVTNVSNGKSVDVCINDRGPYHSKRTIDLSKSAFKKIGRLGKGTARVKLKVLHKPKSYRYGKRVCS